MDSFTVFDFSPLLAVILNGSYYWQQDGSTGGFDRTAFIDSAGLQSTFMDWDGQVRAAYFSLSSQVLVYRLTSFFSFVVLLFLILVVFLLLVWHLNQTYGGGPSGVGPAIYYYNNYHVRSVVVHRVCCLSFPDFFLSCLALTASANTGARSLSTSSATKPSLCASMIWCADRV